MEKRKKNNIPGIFITFFTSVCVVFCLIATQGCVPTYPKEKLSEAVKEVCRIEYGMDVEATVKGATMGIYYPMEGLLDVGMGISEEAWDKIGNLLLIASRVVLSTDADIKFYCVITQDAKLPELQVVIIKYVNDVKRGMYRNISRGESFKRTLFSINLTPQAKKERSIEKIFEKMGVDEKTRQSVLDDFFRSPPTKLSDIGYWRGKFYIKEISIPEFLAAQIANRVKYAFKDNEDLSDLFTFQAVEGLFIPSSMSFVLKYKIQDEAVTDNIQQLRLKKLKNIIEVAHQVFRGYKYKDYKLFVLIDLLENIQLTVAQKQLNKYDEKRTDIKDIVTAPAGFI
jgi:hypothetical protein